MIHMYSVSKSDMGAFFVFHVSLSAVWVCSRVAYLRSICDVELGNGKQYFRTSGYVLNPELRRRASDFGVPDLIKKVQNLEPRSVSVFRLCDDLLFPC